MVFNEPLDRDMILQGEVAGGAIEILFWDETGGLIFVVLGDGRTDRPLPSELVMRRINLRIFGGPSHQHFERLSRI